MCRNGCTQGQRRWRNQIDPLREGSLPEDVGGVLELGSPLGLATVAASREFSHVCGTELEMDELL